MVVLFIAPYSLLLQLGHHYAIRALLITIIVDAAEADDRCQSAVKVVGQRTVTGKNSCPNAYSQRFRQ